MTAMPVVPNRGNKASDTFKMGTPGSHKPSENYSPSQQSTVISWPQIMTNSPSIYWMWPTETMRDNK